MSKRNLPGYSLLEVVVVVGLLVIIATFAFPFSIAQIRQTRARAAASDLSSRIFNIQQNANSSLNNYSYGIEFSSNSFTIITGADLANPDSTETIYFENGVSISNISLVSAGDRLTFSAGEFRPNTNGSVVITSGTSSYGVYVNREGLIYYTQI